MDKLSRGEDGGRESFSGRETETTKTSSRSKYGACSSNSMGFSFGWSIEFGGTERRYEGQTGEALSSRVTRWI